MNEAERGKNVIFDQDSNPFSFWVPKSFKFNQIKILIGSDRARTAQNWLEGDSVATAL